MSEADKLLENYNEIKFSEYIKNKGNADWEIAWNKRMLELIDKDPTGGAKEKRIRNIKYWEKVRNNNVKRGN